MAIVGLGCLALVPALCGSKLPLPERARYVFQRVGENLGLATTTATCLFQDHEGFIWIGTDHGLLRYDGTRVVRYGQEQGIAGLGVGQIAEDGIHRLWVTQHSSLSVREGRNFEFVKLPSGLDSVPLNQAIAIRGQDEVFLATDHGILSPLHLTRRAGVLEAEGKAILPGVRIDAIYAATDGRVWFAAAGGVGWLDQSSQVHWMSRSVALSHEAVVALLQDGAGRLWVRTSKHLFWLGLGASRLEMDAGHVPPANDVGAPALDREGRLLVPTVSGLYIREGEGWKVVDKGQGMSTNAVLSIMEDREGTYWIGFGGNGLEQWRGERTWSGWTDNEGLPDDVVWSEVRDHQHRLWLGTNDGVAMWDSDARRFRVWKQKDGLNGATARVLTVASDGAIWVLCHPGGLTRFASDHMRPEKVAFAGTDPTFMALAPDGRIWISGPHYLKVIRYEHGRVSFEDIAAPLDIAENSVHFSFSPDGSVWVCGRKGMARFKDGIWSRFGAREGLQGRALLQVAAVSANEAWILYADNTGVGHVRVRNSRVQVTDFGAAQGLASDQAYMLGLDHAGNAWVGGPSGVARITGNHQICRFSHSDGLIWEDQSEGGFFADDDGTLLFGTSGGLARFDPSSETAKSLLPATVVLTTVQLGGVSRLGENRPSVPYEENTLRAEFAVLSYRDPAALRCGYHLNGLEKEFVSTDLREVRYPALPPGTYQLEIACNLRGVASAPLHYPFLIRPAWWQRTGARALALVTLLIALYGILRLRTFRLEKDRTRLEQAVRERSAELERLNQELREAALTDPLTGTRNRRFFQMTIEADVNHTLRAYQQPQAWHERNRDLIFYLIDADHFKQVNDLYGHDAGDELLVEMTRRIACAIRHSDILVRWGGEEFMVVSRYTDRAEATTLAARILHSMAADPFRLAQVNERVNRTCSIGWAVFPWFPLAPNAITYETVLALADQALYAAKQDGRNCAIGFVSEMEESQAVIAAASLSPDKVPFRRVRTPGPQPARSARAGT
ncbi:MAG: diguanylate cyclase [Acidobacteria bacterium]|nr:diguanylate cyclase [Acidobacteriota bacterium]